MINYLDDLKNRTSAKLLIVDDEPKICSLFTRALSLAGYTAETANSGQEALVLLERAIYDLMLLDLQMPGMNGLEVMRRARQLCPNLLIIILTGHATLESAIAGAKSDEVVDYLCKPVEPHQIINAVTQALKKQTMYLLQQRIFDLVSQALEIPSELEKLVESKKSPNSYGFELDTIIAPPLILNRRKRLVTLETSSPATVDLTKGETALLSSLMIHAGQVLSCEELVRLGWGYNIDDEEAKSIVRPHIRRLRQKIEPDPKAPHLICTVRRHGYRLNAGQA